MPNKENTINFYLKTLWGGIALVFFLPLFIYEEFLFPFVFPRTIAFRILVEILLFIYIMLSVRKPSFRPRQSAIAFIMAIFIIILLLTSALGVDWHHSFWSSIERSEGILTWLHLYGFFIILIGIVRTKSEWLHLFKIIIISGWLQSLYALGQVINLPFTFNATGQRVGGAIGNPSFLATYLIFIIFIAAYLYIEQPTKKSRMYYGSSIIINIFIIWNTGTRGAILALAIGILFFLTITLWQKRKAHYRIIVIFLLMILPILGILLKTYKNSNFVQSSNTLNAIANISPRDITTFNRLIVWNVGLEAFKDRPLRGWGWENFTAAFNKHFNPIISKDIGSRPWYDRTHNIIVEIGVTSGFFGLLAYCFVFFYALKFLYKRETKDKGIKTSNVIIVSLLVTYGIQNLFVFDTLNSYIIFFTILAFSHTTHQLRKNERQKNISSKVQNTSLIKIKEIAPWIHTNSTQSIITIFSIFILLSVIYWVNIRPTLANYLVVKAVTQYKDNPLMAEHNFRNSFHYSPPEDQELRFILVQQARNHIAQRGLTEEAKALSAFAIEEMEKTVFLAPHYIPNSLILSELYLNLAPSNPQYVVRAEEVILDTLIYAPERYQTYTMLARIKIFQGKFEEGIKILQETIRLNENFAESYWNLAIAYILNSQTEYAKEPLEKALYLGFPIYEEKNIGKLIEAYKDSKDLIATIEFLRDISARLPENKNYQQMLEALETLYAQALGEASKTNLQKE